MPIRVRLFNKPRHLNEADTQNVAAQIAQLQQMQLTIERKATLQIQNIEKQKQQQIDAIKAKIINLQSQLNSANINVTANTDNKNVQTANNSQSGISANNP